MNFKLNKSKIISALTYLSHANTINNLVNYNDNSRKGTSFDKLGKGDVHDSDRDNNIISFGGLPKPKRKVI